MGNTIRRKPITFDIPKSPDYKYLNITNFNGLDMTDNLFAASHNTASDSLNVYVDEFGALTTRPRLEKKKWFINDVEKSLEEILPENSIVDNIFSITDGYLIHYHDEDGHHLNLFKNDILTNITVENTTIPTTEIKIFEHDKSIYILDGSKYQVIEKDTTELKLVEGYVPTIRVGRNVGKDLEYSIYEDLNLLSDKFKESYFWDGTWDIEKTLKLNDTNRNVKNDYVSEQYVMDSYNVKNYGPIKYLPSKNTDNQLHFLCKDVKYYGNLNRTPTLKIINNNTSEIANEIGPKNEQLPVYWSDIDGDYSENIDMYVLRFSHFYDEAYLSTGGIYLCNEETQTAIKISEDSEDNFIDDDLYDIVSGYKTSNNLASFSKRKIRISNNGKTIVSYDVKNILIYKIDDNLNVTCKRIPYSNSYICDVDVTDDGNTVLVMMNTKDLTDVITFKSYIGNVSNKIPTTLFDTIQIYDGINDKSIDNIEISKTINSDENYFYCGHSLSNDFLVLAQVKSDDTDSFLNFYKHDSVNVYNSDKKMIISFHKNDYIFLSLTNEKLYYKLYDEAGWILLQDYTKINGKRWNIGFVSDVTRSQYGANIIAKNIPYSTETEQYNNNLFTTYFFNSIEPLLFVERNMTKENSDKYDEWLKRRNVLFSSQITNRFQNERWFASKNKTFRTINNNPAYIGYSTYNANGDTDEEITSMSIVSDQLLTLYFKNKMFMVSPQIINDVSDFVYNESKNTTGNIPKNASIITTLTETPLHISKEGIYKLNQLENIQSSDLISTLISESIDKKWLIENDIENLKTINYKYWTCFILDSDNNSSNVYILDNRINSWYFWKLPIQIYNAFVKDDVMELVSKDNNIYDFKTTDIQNKYNPSLTEYYDDGEKIINWYWKSQILPLGTINYSKKLLESTFIVADTDDSDEFGFNYKFKVFRKLANETNTTTITNKLNLIQSTTKRTLVPRFNFIQLELSNVEDDLNNNKMRLLGIGLKYTLLEALR